MRHCSTITYRASLTASSTLGRPKYSQAKSSPTQTAMLQQPKPIAVVQDFCSHASCARSSMAPINIADIGPAKTAPMITELGRLPIDPAPRRMNGTAMNPKQMPMIDGRDVRPRNFVTNLPFGERNRRTRDGARQSACKGAGPNGIADLGDPAKGASRDCCHRHTGQSAEENVRQPSTRLDRRAVQGDGRLADARRHLNLVIRILHDFFAPAGNPKTRLPSFHRFAKKRATLHPDFFEK